MISYEHYGLYEHYPLVLIYLLFCLIDEFGYAFGELKLLLFVSSLSETNEKITTGFEINGVGWGVEK